MADPCPDPESVSFDNSEVSFLVDESDCCVGSIRLFESVDELDELDELDIFSVVSAAKQEILKLSATINKTLVNIIRPSVSKEFIKIKTHLNIKFIFI
ncbi:hypothetical protein [Nitrosomonas sp. Nm33]|uniref:hypothetical protein n=1 Tax=Nitrosomonas sp. Nm33 TaxID=133724 RepID=UPI000B84BBCD|nr:hypothetical protein [Nitrosomonas sp. Nm33]